VETLVLRCEDCGDGLAFCVEEEGVVEIGLYMPKISTIHQKKSSDIAGGCEPYLGKCARMIIDCADFFRVLHRHHIRSKPYHLPILPMQLHMNIMRAITLYPSHARDIGPGCEEGAWHVTEP